MKKSGNNDWLIIIGFLAMILAGIDTIVSKQWFTRDGRPVSEDEAVRIGIFIVISCAFCLVGLIRAILMGKKADKEDKSGNTIRCPCCGREKAARIPGKYKCKECGQKFVVGSDGKVILQGSKHKHRSV